MASESTPRGHRTTEVGKVISRSGQQTIVVEVIRRVRDRLYKKYVSRRRRFHTHDERNECQVGDRVRIAATRPMSRLKRWRLIEILSRKPGEALAAAAAPDQPEAGGAAE